MDLLDVLKKNYIAELSPSELKSVLQDCSSQYKILVNEPQRIVINNGKVLGCIAKYYKPKDGERIRPKSSTIQTCMNTRKKMINEDFAKTDLDCVKCHIECMNLKKQGLLERI